MPLLLEKKRGGSWGAETVREVITGVLTDGDIIIGVVRFLGHVVLIVVRMLLSVLLT